MASPNVAFSQIPAGIRKPGQYLEFNTQLAVRNLPGNLIKMLVIAQMTAAGSAAANSLQTVFSDADAQAYFGVGSQAHLMVRAALKANPYLQLDVVGVADAGASIAATKTVTIAGPATGIGVLTLNIANAQVAIVVNAADTANTIAANLAAQITLQPDLPMSASVVGAVVTLTALNKGAQGNNIVVSSTVTATGVTATVASGVTGATDPTLTTALANVFAAGHNIIASAWNDSTTLTAINTYLTQVSGPMEQRGALGVFGLTGSLSTSTTLALALDSGRLTGALARGSISQPCEVAAAYAAVIASESDPARPLNTLPLTGIALVSLSNNLGRTEQENLLANGITPLELGPGSVMQIVRAISTYTVNPQNIPDPSLLDITTIRTLDYVRLAIRQRIALRFPREKLSDRTPPKVRSEILDVLLKCEELEFVEQVTQNQAALIVERDSQSANQLNAKIPANVVNGLHVFAAVINLIL